MLRLRWSGAGIWSILWVPVCCFIGVGTGSGAFDLGRGTCAAMLVVLVVGAVPAALAGAYVFNRRPSLLDVAGVRHTAFGLPMEAWTLASHLGLALALGCVVLSAVLPTFVAVIVFVVLLISLSILAGILSVSVAKIVYLRRSQEYRKYAQQLGHDLQLAKYDARAVWLVKVGLYPTLSEALPHCKPLQTFGLFDGTVFIASVMHASDARPPFTRLVPNGSDEEAYAVALAASLPDATVQADSSGQWAVRAADPDYADVLRAAGVVDAVAAASLPNLAIRGGTILTGTAAVSSDYTIPIADVVRTLQVLTAITARLSRDVLTRFGTHVEDPWPATAKHLVH